MSASNAETIVVSQSSHSGTSPGLANNEEKLVSQVEAYGSHALVRNCSRLHMTKGEKFSA